MRLRMHCYDSLDTRSACNITFHDNKDTCGNQLIMHTNEKYISVSVNILLGYDITPVFKENLTVPKIALKEL